MSFAAFWAIWPHKVGKIDAQKAFAQAVKQGFSPDDIIAGVPRYIASKEPWRAWKHPGPWIRAGMWMDEPANGARFSAVEHSKSLEDIAAHINRPWYQFGRYHPDIVQQCVEAGLVTPERAREVL